METNKQIRESKQSRSIQMNEKILETALKLFSEKVENLIKIHESSKEL